MYFCPICTKWKVCFGCIRSNSVARCGVESFRCVPGEWRVVHGLQRCQSAGHNVLLLGKPRREYVVDIMYTYKIGIKIARLSELIQSETYVGSSCI